MRSSTGFQQHIKKRVISFCLLETASYSAWRCFTFHPSFLPFVNEVTKSSGRTKRRNRAEPKLFFFLDHHHSFGSVDHLHGQFIVDSLLWSHILSDKSTVKKKTEILILPQDSTKQKLWHASKAVEKVERGEKDRDIRKKTDVVREIDERRIIKWTRGNSSVQHVYVFVKESRQWWCDGSSKDKRGYWKDSVIKPRRCLFLCLEERRTLLLAFFYLLPLLCVLFTSVKWVNFCSGCSFLQVIFRHVYSMKQMQSIKDSTFFFLFVCAYRLIYIQLLS